MSSNKLLEAVEKKNLFDVEHLVKQPDIDINYQKKNGTRYSSLHVACQEGYYDIVRVLLQDHRINANQRDGSWWAPFYAACNSGRTGVVTLMMQDARVDMNKENTHGWTPLIRACFYGYPQIVKILLSHGRKIDINHESLSDDGGIQSGSTALYTAKRSKQTDIVKLLEEYQKNPTETAKQWRTQLNFTGKQKQQKKVFTSASGQFQMKILRPLTLHLKNQRKVIT